MAATDIVTISNSLVTIANGITTTATFDGFKSVFEYMPEQSEIEGSPILIVVPEQVENSFETTQDDETVWSFRMSIYVMIDDNTTRAITESQMKYAAGHLIQALEEAWDYTDIPGGGNYLATNIANWSALRGDYLVTDITVQVNLLNNTNG